MEKAGIITGYGAQVDATKVGRPLQAIVRVRVAPGQEACELLLKVLDSSPGLLACHRVTGAACYYVHVAIESVGALERLLDSLIPYGETITAMVLSTPVERKAFGPLSSVEPVATRAVPVQQWAQAWLDPPPSAAGQRGSAHAMPAAPVSLDGVPNEARLGVFDFPEGFDNPAADTSPPGFPQVRQESTRTA